MRVEKQFPISRKRKGFVILALSCLLTFHFAAIVHANTLLGITWGNPSHLVSFDPFSGTIIADHNLTSPSNGGFTGLTYDPNHNTLYALDQMGPLYSINPSTLQTTRVGNLGVVGEALAYDWVNDKLYTVANGFLSTVNVSNGQLTPIGSVSGYITSLSYNPNDGLLCGLAVDGSGSWDSPYKSYVVTINPNTAAESTLFTTPYHTMMGLAMIPGEDEFVSWVNWTSHTYALTDLHTGSVTLLGGSDSVDVISAMVYQDFYVTTIPEPTSLALLGLAGTLIMLKRKKVR
jgi:hypothetical protein